MRNLEEMLNPMLNRKDLVVDVLTEFFGEEYRDRIRQNIENTEFFFVDKYSSSIKTIDTTLGRHLTQDFIDNTGFETGHSILKSEDLYFLRKDIETRSFSSEYSRFHIWCFLRSCGVDIAEEQVLSWLKTPANHKFAIVKIREAVSLWNKDFKPQEVDCREYYEDLEVPEYISESLYEKIDDAYFTKTAELFEGKDVDIDGLSYIYRDMINAYRYGISDFWLDESSRYEFLKFFYDLGYDLGDDIEDYFSDTRIILSVFDIDFLTNIEKLEKKSDILQIISNHQFEKIQDRVRALDLKSGDFDAVVSFVSYLSSASESNEIGGYINYEMGGDGKVKPILVLPTEGDLDEDTFWHELAHLAEYMFISSDDNSFTIKNGIETMIKSTSVEKKDFDVDTYIDLLYSPRRWRDRTSVDRDYSILNEVIHNILVGYICKIAESKGISVGLNSKQNSSYENARPILEGFVRDNLDFIKRCVMSEDQGLLKRALGESNMDTLSDAVSFLVGLDSASIDNIAFELQLNGTRGVGNLSSVTRQYLTFLNEAREALKGFDKSRVM